MTIGERIFFIRTFRHLSREKLASAVNALVPNKKITADRIQKYENGHRNPREDVLQAIASVLNVNYDTLAAPDVNPTNILSIMFELENTLDISLENDENKFSIIINKTAGDNTYDEINYDLNNWYAKRKECTPNPTDSEEVAGQKIADYKIWKTMYPLDTLENEKAALSAVQRKFKNAIAKTDKSNAINTDKDFVKIVVNILLSGLDARYIRKMLAYGEQIALLSFKADDLLALTTKTQNPYIEYLLCNKKLSEKYGMIIDTHTHTDSGIIYIDYYYRNSEIRNALFYIEQTLKPFIKNGTFDSEEAQAEYSDYLQFAPVSFKNLLDQDKINS